MMGSMPVARTCCLDLDTFFVSVERLLDPSLVGRPVIVGASPGHRGVVTACSYEVRPLGVRSGMSMRDAVKLAPHAVYLPTRHGTYSPYAGRVKQVLERYCPVVRTASIDEFFLDFRGCEALYATPGDTDADATIQRVVWEMRDTIQREVGLPASAGIGTTRAVAKMASGSAKPAGVLMVRAGQERAWAAGLPVRRFPGIGPAAEGRLRAAGVETLGQLVDHRGDEGPLASLVDLVRSGLDGTGPGALARDRPAFQEHDVAGEEGGSISNERTFHADVARRDLVDVQLRMLVERVAWRARQRGAVARTITVKLRHADFDTHTASRTLPATTDEPALLHAARALLDHLWAPRKAVRLLGVALSGLARSAQLPLPFPQERPAFSVALDAVRARFGYDAIRLGATAER